MHKGKKRSLRRNALEPTFSRREALKGLGALAASLPVLGNAACSASNAPSTTLAPSTGGPGGSAASGTVGASATSVGAPSTGSAGAGSPSGGAAGNVAGAAGTTGNPTAGTAGTTSAAGKGGASAAGASGSSAAGGAGSGELIPVTWDNVASCTLTPTDPAGEGPFFVHDDEAMNDVSLIRSDMRDGKPGIELQLNLRVLDSAGCMTPISGVQVYVWHTDATGFYSGFNSQNPDQSYTGGLERTVENTDRFCRGVQLTDKDGVVSFRTVYPGWYNGRAIHIHFVALRPGSGPDTMSYRSTQYMVFTTQMYFAEQFSRMIHEHNAPYMTRASGAGYNMYVKPQNTTVNPTMRMQGNVAVGALNVITAASGSRR